MLACKMVPGAPPSMWSVLRDIGHPSSIMDLLVQTATQYVQSCRPDYLYHSTCYVRLVSWCLSTPECHITESCFFFVALGRVGSRLSNLDSKHSIED